MDKIQELTDKLYKEGVEKGNENAAKLVKDANEKSKDIIDAANKKAEEIIKEANKKAEELQVNTQSELKLFTRQSVEALKTEIADIINGEVVSDSVKAATADKDFMQKMILKLVEGLVENGEAVIQANDAKSLKTYFESQAKESFNKKIKIEKVNGNKTDFVIVAKGGAYKIEFGQAELIEYFKQFLRPELVKMLF